MDQETKSRILKSIPFLQSQGEKLTSRMYEILFEENPELKGMFNGDNSKKTCRRLACFCAEFRKDRSVKNCLKQYGLIHVRAGVKPKHYDKVWNALYKAMLEFSISDEIIKAWNNAYQLLANILINKEEKLYTCLKPNKEA